MNSRPPGPLNDVAILVAVFFEISIRQQVSANNQTGATTSRPLVRVLLTAKDYAPHTCLIEDLKYMNYYSIHI